MIHENAAGIFLIERTSPIQDSDCNIINFTNWCFDQTAALQKLFYHVFSLFPDVQQQERQILACNRKPSTFPMYKGRIVNHIISQSTSTMLSNLQQQSNIHHQGYDNTSGLACRGSPRITSKITQFLKVCIICSTVLYLLNNIIPSQRFYSTETVNTKYKIFQ